MIDDQETCELDCYKRADKIPKIVLISWEDFLKLIFVTSLNISFDIFGAQFQMIESSEKVYLWKQKSRKTEKRSRKFKVD